MVSDDEVLRTWDWMKRVTVEVTWLEPRLETIAALTGYPLADLSQEWDDHIVRGTD